MLVVFMLLLSIPLAVTYSNNSFNLGSSDAHTLNTEGQTYSVTSVSRGGNPPGGSAGIAFDEANGYIYVTSLETWSEYQSGIQDSNVTVINPTTNQVVTTVRIGFMPKYVAVDSSNGDIYVTDILCVSDDCNTAVGDVSVIDGSTNKLIANVTVGSEPWGLAFDSANGDVYVANLGSNTVSVINGSTNQVVTNVPVGFGPFAVAFDPSNEEVYVTNWAVASLTHPQGTVSVINDSTNQVVATTSVGIGPDALAFDPVNGEIYVSSSGFGNFPYNLTQNSVSVINGSTNDVVANVSISGKSGAPSGIAFDGADGNMYVTQRNPGGNNISVISSVTNTIIATVPIEQVNSYLQAFAYDSSSGNIYVLDGAGPIWSIAPTVRISCNTELVTGLPVECAASVMGSSPTGKVTWSSGTGKFSPLTCKLSKTKDSCNVRYTPLAAGLVAMSASYGGNTKNQASSGTFSLNVLRAASKTTLSCSQSSVMAGSSKNIKCTARVIGYSPTGTVTWSQSGTGSVQFSSSICTLFKGTCSITVTGASAGTVTIQASYSGDSNNLPSSAPRNLSVK